MTNLFSLKAQSQSLELIFPGKGAFDSEAKFVEHFIKEAFAPGLGLLPVAWILFNVRLHPGIEDALAIGFAVKAGVQVEPRASQVETDFTRDSLEIFQPIGQQHDVDLIEERNRHG